MRNYRWTVSLTIVFFVLGIFLSLQYQSQIHASSDLAMQRTENLIAMVRDLSEKRQNLALEIIDLNMQFNTQLSSFNDENELTESLNSEMAKLGFLTGINELKGPGLVVTITQSMPILYVDIIDIINELWAAGAEAISINDMRINNHSIIYYTEDSFAMYITLDGLKLHYPVVIKAIGEPNNLEKGLTLPGGIIDNLALFKAFPVLEKSNSLELGPVSSSASYLFLKEYKPPEQGTTPAAVTDQVPGTLPDTEKPTNLTPLPAM